MHRGRTVAQARWCVNGQEHRHIMTEVFFSDAVIMRYRGVAGPRLCVCVTM